VSIVNVQNARSVIGVELCSEAVEDAKTNASNNGKLLTPALQLFVNYF